MFHRGAFSHLPVFNTASQEHRRQTFKPVTNCSIAFDSGRECRCRCLVSTRASGLNPRRVVFTYFFFPSQCSLVSCECVVMLNSVKGLGRPQNTRQWSESGASNQRDLRVCACVSMHVHVYFVYGCLYAWVYTDACACVCLPMHVWAYVYWTSVQKNKLGILNRKKKKKKAPSSRNGQNRNSLRAIRPSKPFKQRLKEKCHKDVFDISHF